MLKGIPAILSPELLKILCEMGHSDELVIGDGNFPSASHAQKLILLRWSFHFGVAGRYPTTISPGQVCCSPCCLDGSSAWRSDQPCYLG